MTWNTILDNRTPAIARSLLGFDSKGVRVVLTVARLTYRVSPAGVVRVTGARAPIRTSDERGAFASLRRPSDFVVAKPGTDVLLLGTAHPPTGARVSEMDVQLRVGPIDKTLRVYGPRVYYESPFVVPGPAAALGPTPLVYDFAYGGTDSKHRAKREPRNPVGVGFAADRAELVGRPAHRIEDRRGPSPATTPAGFGPIPASWSPRVERFGTADEAWRRERVPVPPEDFDPRFGSCAPPDQWSPIPLRGNEPVEIVGVRPEGPWRFRLPTYAPYCRVRVDGVEQRIDPHLDTFLIDADEREVELTWRVAVPAPRKLASIGPIRLFGEPALPPDLFDRPAAQEANVT